jgi:hypothetical protein
MERWGCGKASLSAAVSVSWLLPKRLQRYLLCTTLFADAVFRVLRPRLHLRLSRAIALPP